MPKLERFKLYGINKDIEVSELPNNVYSNGLNMRFVDGRTEKIKGYTGIFGTLSDSPLRVLNYNTPTTNYWLYGGTTGVFVTDGTTHFNITPTVPVTTDIVNRWNVTYLNGVPIYNNKEDGPIWWDGLTTSPMTEIPGWISGDKCDVIRSYKVYLIALNVTESGTKYPHKIKWSNAANPGALPDSWTPLDTNDAGDGILAETPDEIIDGLSLQDDFLIYKQKSTHILRYIGGRYVFANEELFGSFGALAEGCVIEFDQQHAVLTTTDFIVHDGNSFRSVIDEKWRVYLFNKINNDYLDVCFLQLHYSEDEIWICIPTSNGLADTAIVWNYRDETFYERELPSAYDIGRGVVIPNTIPSTWDADTDSWDSDSTTWDEKAYSSVSESLLICDYSTPSLLHLDNSESFNGVSFLHYIERTSMQINSKDDVKLVDTMWPVIKGSAGDEINIQVGTQLYHNDPIDWIPVQKFTIGVNNNIDFFVEGKYISVRFSSSTTNSWSLHNFSLGIKSKGNY